MKIYFLKHSGFAVDTGSRRLIFDYFFEDPAGGTLEQGVVTPELLTDKPLVVFASHFHQDHYHKLILDWPNRHPDCTLYLGKGIRSGGTGRVVKPYENFTENGIHIRTLRSTDSGVAFLVQADGLNLYHAGDLNWWRWEGEPDDWNRDMEKNYKKEINLIVVVIVMTQRKMKILAKKIRKYKFLTSLCIISLSFDLKMI